MPSQDVRASPVRPSEMTGRHVPRGTKATLASLLIAVVAAGAVVAVVGLALGSGGVGVPGLGLGVWGAARAVQLPRVADRVEGPDRRRPRPGRSARAGAPRVQGALRRQDDLAAA